MDTFRKILAALCAVLFVLGGVLALFALNIEWRAFEAAAYKQAFEKQSLYERVPGIMADAMYSTTAGNPDAHPFLKAMTAADWQTTITAILPPEELRAITNSALDSVLDYVNGESDSAVISLMPLKSNLFGPAGMQVANQILRAQPECTVEQLLQMGLEFASGQMALCNPPEEMRGMVTPLIELQVQTIAGSIPEAITLISSEGVDPAADPRLRLNQARTLMKITPVFPLLFLLGITVFGVRSLLDWLKWWGWPLLITGAGSALIAALGAPLFGIAAERLLQTRGAAFLPPILFSAARETIGAVTSQILQPVLVEGLMLTALGFVMAAIGFWLAHRNRPSS